MAKIATSGNGFCDGLMAFFAKFARTLAKFAIIVVRYLGQPVPAVRKTAKAYLSNRALLLLGSASGELVLLM